MRPSIKPFWLLLGAALGLRLISMWLLPFADTTEPRYAEIARLMASSGDWITPWFEPGVPFWGKPPLAFWSQALAFRLGGINEFAARLPSLLVTAATLALIFKLARQLFDTRTARWAALIYATSLLPYVMSGAVLTDPFLVLGTTLSLTSFALAAQRPASRWGYGFFIGLAIGLLAKGPLALVLVFGPMLPWALWHRQGWQYLLALPWRMGVPLCSALCLPWYIVAELKTPGFLRYFLLGENLLRFIDPGWVGDRYGNGHQQPHGMIWLHWLAATFPWGIVALAALWRPLFASDQRQRLLAPLRDCWRCYLLSWSLFTLLFFTLAGNILWTYALPALPAFAILLAEHLQRHCAARRRRWLLTASVVPLAIVALTLAVLVKPQSLRSEKALVEYAEQHAGSQSRLLYLESRPFSARFYSCGRAELVTLQQLRNEDRSDTVQLAIPKRRLAAVEMQLGVALHPLFTNRRYALVALPATADVAVNEPSSHLREQQ